MNSGTIKSRTIVIASGEDMQVYRSEAEVPADLRKTLDECTKGANAATILIADRKGREELMRAIQGLPTSLKVTRRLRRKDEAEPRKYLQFVDLGVVGAIGLIVWALFLFR